MSRFGYFGLGFCWKCHDSAILPPIVSLLALEHVCWTVGQTKLMYREMLSDDTLVPHNQRSIVWGAFPLTHRWNFDQVPLPFVIDLGRTLAPEGAERVHVKTPSASLKKRQATLQVLIRADGKQGRLAIIFRGKGNITEEEQASYDELDIDVYFQPKAWADSEFTIAWLNRTMKEAVKDTPGIHLALCDNLAGQDVRPTAGAIGERVAAVAKAIRVKLWNLLAGATDEIQPVDAGVGGLVKHLTGVEADIWLDDADNFARWEGTPGAERLSAPDRRILMAQWASKAWAKLATKDGAMRNYFDRTGTGIGLAGAVDPADGQLVDSKVKLEGLGLNAMAAYREGLIKKPAPLPEKSLEDLLTVRYLICFALFRTFGHHPG